MKGHLEKQWPYLCNIIDLGIEVLIFSEYKLGNIEKIEVILFDFFLRESMKYQRPYFISFTIEAIVFD